MNTNKRQMPHPDPVYSGSGTGSFSLRSRRSKYDWAGIGIGDAFKQNLDYSLRMPAQRLFYDACRKIQVAAAKMAGFSVDGSYSFKAKPQLAPCYTAYPSTLAAYAAVGLTGYIEFTLGTSSKILATYLADYQKRPEAYDLTSADPKAFRALVIQVTQIVQTRLIIEDLSRAPDMSVIEIYRLFSASQQSFRFESLSEILSAVILYGDILPDWKHQSMHPLTENVLVALDCICRPYFDRLSMAGQESFLDLGSEWVREVAVGLAKFLPDAQEEIDHSESYSHHDDSGSRERRHEGPCKFGNKSAPSIHSRIGPLNGPNPPALFDMASAAEQAASSLMGGAAGNSREENEREESSQARAAMEAVASFIAAVNQTGSQKAQWEDMRSDRIERALRTGAFAESPVQGSQTDGHQVQVLLDGRVDCTGEVFDRPVELSNNLMAYNKLLGESYPIAEALKRNLYPNVEQSVETERLRSNGSLDPARLALAEFSTVIFRRHRIREQVDRRGAPVLLIACDGSASLNAKQMGMLKVLTAAWLNSTVRTRVQIMAGLYHSGIVRKGLNGPLVQWIFHPRKTPAVSHKEAARALVTLPNTGTGVQSDALSLSFMLNEAVHLARGRSIYLILISDCEWNRSFRSEMSGKDEVCSFFRTARADCAGRLHTTLVALGVRAETGLEGLVDSIIPVPNDQLEDYPAVAEKIGVYVASCMKERR